MASIPRKEFQYGTPLKVTFWALLVALSAFICFALYKGILHGKPDDKFWAGLVVVMFSLLLAYIVSAIRKLDNIIITDSTGITLRHKNKQDVFLAWHQIDRIAEHRLAQNMTVSNSALNMDIKIEYQINHFSELQNIIAQQAVHIQQQNQNLKTFTRSRFLIIALFLISLVFIVPLSLLIHEGQLTIGLGLLFGVLSALSVFLGLVQPHTLHINNSDLVIEKMFSKKTIPFTDIVSISLHTLTSKQNQYPVVAVALKNKRKLLLSGYKEGEIALLSALNKSTGLGDQPN